MSLCWLLFTLWIACSVPLFIRKCWGTEVIIVISTQFFGRAVDLFDAVPPTVVLGVKNVSVVPHNISEVACHVPATLSCLVSSDLRHLCHVLLPGWEPGFPCCCLCGSCLRQTKTKSPGEKFTSLIGRELRARESRCWVDQSRKAFSACRRRRTWCSNSCSGPSQSKSVCR